MLITKTAGGGGMGVNNRTGVPEKNTDTEAHPWKIGDVVGRTTTMVGDLIISEEDHQRNGVCI